MPCFYRMCGCHSDPGTCVPLETAADFTTHSRDVKYIPDRVERCGGWSLRCHHHHPVTTSHELQPAIKKQLASAGPLCKQSAPHSRQIPHQQLISQFLQVRCASQQCQSTESHEDLVKQPNASSLKTGKPPSTRTHLMALFPGLPG